MDRKEMFGRARFFKVADLPTPKVATIDYVAMERLKDLNSDNGGTNEKPVVTFSDDPRQLVLNATNYDAISDFSGLWNTDDWPGLRIELCAATDTNQKGETYEWVKAREAPEPAAVEADPGANNVKKMPERRHATRPARDDLDDQILILGAAAMTTMIAAALKLAEKGLAVFPCRPHDKVPVTVDGFKSASRDPAAIEAWWRAWSNCNVGVATGAPSSVFVIDVDIKDDGEKSIRQMESEFGELPPTVESVTPSGGRHLFFKYPEWDVGCSVGKIASGIDVRGSGGYIVAPPSVGKNARRYYWSVDSAGGFADAPSWLLEKIKATAASVNGNGTLVRMPPSEWRTLAAANVLEGVRNVTAAKMTGHLLRRYVDPHLVHDLVQCWNAVRCQPPLPPEDITRVVDSICRREFKRRTGNAVQQRGA